MFENKEFENSSFDKGFEADGSANFMSRFDEPAPSDVAYNFGASTAAGVAAKAVTYLASALALGGSLFVSNQLLVAPNLQHADQANAAGQSQDPNAANSATGAAAANAAGANNAANAAGVNSSAADGSAGSLAGADNGQGNSAFGVTSHGGKRFATTSTAPSPTADPSTPSASPSPSQTTVVVPPPTFGHGNTSNATQVSSGNGGSNFGGDEGDDQEYEGSDD